MRCILDGCVSNDVHILQGCLLDDVHSSVLECEAPASWSWLELLRPGDGRGCGVSSVEKTSAAGSGEVLE